MIDSKQNKQIGNKDFKSRSGLRTSQVTEKKLVRYFFPTLGISVYAESLEEATLKAKNYTK